MSDMNEKEYVSYRKIKLLKWLHYWVKLDVNADPAPGGFDEEDRIHEEIKQIIEDYFGGKENAKESKDGRR